MNRAIFVGFVALSGTALSMGDTLAAPPPQCTQGPGLRSYESAYRTQARFLEKLFETQYGCQQLEAFSEKVAAISMGLSGSDPCRASANRDAGTDTINKVTNDCLTDGGGGPAPTAEAESALQAASCIQNGREEGKMRGLVYCQLIGLAPTIGEPPSICDQLTAIYCRNAFNATVTGNEECRQKALNDPHYKEAVEAACAPNQ